MSAPLLATAPIVRAVTVLALALAVVGAGVGAVRSAERATASAVAWVRVVNALAGGTAIDVEAGGVLVASALPCTAVSGYATVPVGGPGIIVRLPGAAGAVVAATEAPPAGTAVTVVVMGRAPERAWALALPDGPERAGASEATVRVVHAVEAAPTVNAALDGEPDFAPAVSFGGLGETRTPAGMRLLRVTTSVDGAVLAGLAIDAPAGGGATVILTPPVDDTWPVRALLLRDGGDVPLAAGSAAGPAGLPAGVPIATTAAMGAGPGPARVEAGGTLLVERFEDAASGALPRESADTTRYFVGYVNGEYSVQKRERSGRSTRRINIPGAYSDITIGTDARLIDDTDSRHVFVGCRYSETNGETNAYRLLVYPERGQVVIARYDAGRRTDLARRSSTTVRRGMLGNRLELTCAGSRIEASVNGVAVASVFDGTYAAGQAYIGVGASSDRFAAEARFDNLVITQR